MSWARRIFTSAGLAMTTATLVVMGSGTATASVDGSAASVDGSARALGSAPASPAPGGALAEPLDYVAIGDSFTSTGSLVGVDPGTFGSFGTPSCFRSTDTYPQQIREQTNWRVTDVSCRGLRTNIAYTGSVDYGDPQLDALHSGVDVVSLQVGGNDTDVLQLAERCALTADCTHLEPEWTAKVDRAAPRVRTLVRDVRARAPHARVLLVGYLQPFPARPCLDIAPFSAANQGFGRRHVDRLNAMLREVAAAERVELVADRTPPGHSGCDRDRWTSFLGVDAGAVPLHPTRAGHLATARMILDRF